MSPEEWLASKQKTEAPSSDSAPMSPEEWMASKGVSKATQKVDVGTATPAGTQRSVGMTPVEETGGGAALLAPTSRRREVPVSEQTFGQDPSRINSVPLEEYKQNILKGAGVGGAIGAGLGALTGPGALVTGAGGALMGGISGLAESVAKDLGYGTGVQTLASLAAGMPAPVKNTVDFLAKSKLASKVFNTAEDVVLGMIPKYGVARKIASVLPKAEPTIAGREAEAALGVEAKTLGVGGNQYRQAATQEIESQFGKGTTGSQLYENAKNAYDQSGNAFLQSPQYQKLVSGLPESTRPAQEARLSQFFKDEAGNAETGDRVVNNLKSYDFFKNLSPKEQTSVRNAFNDYLESKGAGRIEENARKVAEKEFVAKARDELPKYFHDGDSKEISKQIFNYSKDAIGAQAFKEELAHYLAGRKVSEAKTLWGNIADDVNKAIITDPAEFKRISDVINNAKTEKQLSRAKEMLIKAGFGTYQLKKER